VRTARTPGDRFSAIPDFPYEPAYGHVPDGDGGSLRMACVTAGPADGPPVVLLHGEASWSYLFRKVIPELTGAGLRVIAPDLVGFGRSDKPTELSDHSSARHIEWVRAFLFDVLDLRDVTFVGQDWGGSIGLRLLADQPDRFARMVVINAGLPVGDVDMPEVWWEFKRWVDSTEELPVSGIVSSWCAGELSEATLAAYDAPFPEESYKIGPRAMPALVPTSPVDPESIPNLAAWAALSRLDTPLLCAFSAGDPIAGAFAGILKRTVPGAAGREHPLIAGAGHLPAEDAAPALSRHIIDFVAG
jgi:haloalkane dehalogenase